MTTNTHAEQADKSDLIEFKKTFCTAAEAINRMKEPLNELQTLYVMMLDAANKDRAGSDPDFATFLYEDLAPGLAKRLHKERSNDPNVG
jgi:hypothetical protein